MIPSEGVLRALQPVSVALVLAGVGLVTMGFWGDFAGLRMASVVAGAVLVVGGLLHGWSLARTRVALRRLHERLNLMASVAQHVGSPVVVTDNDARVVWCNEAFVRDTGFTLEEIQGERSGRWLRSPQADRDTLEQLRSALRHHEDIDVELLHRYRDGKDRWIRLILTSQRDGAGRFCGYVSVLVDIDAQVRTREAYRKALRDRDALMRTLDEYVMVAETDAKGRFTRVNQRFMDVSGYSEEELLGNRFALLGSGWHPPSFWLGMWSRIQSGRPWRGEVCNRSRQGRLYWVQSLISPFVGENGEIEKFVAIQSDISEHRLARIELSRSQSLLTRTGRLAGVGGWHALPSAGSLQLTPECRQLLGADEKAFRSLDDLWQAFEGDAGPLVREHLKELIAHRRHEVRLVVPVKQDTGASARWVRLVASFGDADTDAADRIQGRIIGAIQDFTPQMQAEQRIREEQRILHSAMDAIGAGFALFDPQRRLRYFNDEYAAWMSPLKDTLLGMRHEDLLRQVASGGLFPEAKGREQEWVYEVLHAPLHGRTDRIRQMANGRWIRFVDRFTADGYRVVFRHDVTQYQEALMQADAAAVSKGQFLANMSHEIRTPINAITGMLQLLSDTGLNERQTDLLGKARVATRSLLDVINDILDFSKIEAGMMQLDEIPFRLSGLRHTLEVILEGARGNPSVQLAFEVDPELPEVVVGDPVRLKQVLINLGGNALKFTPSGSVRVRWRLMGRDDGCVRIRFEVADTGIGIAPELQATIFDSFSQAESSTTRRFGGSGLGLTISQRLVQSMGGQIDLVSAPGHGSTFGFEVVLLEGRDTDIPLEAVDMSTEAQTPLEGVRILLVEDNALNQEVALTLLSEQGAQVTLAENGQLAVDTLRADPEAFDVVLMDLQMPVLDGLRATECIRNELGLPNLPIIAMTANAMVSDRDNCLKAGMNAHIGKPFDLAEVVQVVRRFVGKAAQELTRQAEAAPAPAQGEMPPVLDDAGALRRLGGNRVLLDQLRWRFEAAARALLRQAQARVARGEWRPAADALHQLKGSAGVVGAARLAAACGAMEQWLRGDDTAQHHASAATRMSTLTELLEAVLVCLPAPVGVLPPSPHPGRTDLSAADDGRYLESLLALKPLKSLLENADMDAIEVFERWQTEQAGATDARFQALNRCMEQMDLHGAAQECAHLLMPLDTVDVMIE